MAPARSPRGPIVIGVTSAARARALAVAAEVGLVEVGSTRTGPEHLVVSLGPSAGGALDERVAAGLVAALRDRGLAAVRGPRSDGHAIAWSKRNAPVAFGAGAVVCYPWSVFDRAAASLVVEIDPGAGFGSGGHPTTLLILERLAALDLAGCRVLDVGCGTGVLAIAAALLGATDVCALDIDPAAIAAAERNIAANDVADRVRTVTGELGTVVDDGPYDIVVANIAAGVLRALAPDLRRSTASRGMLAVSGLSPAQPSTLVAELAPMVPIWTDERTDWVALGFRHG